jgi:hypothetical protein
MAVSFKDHCAMPKECIALDSPPSAGLCLLVAMTTGKHARVFCPVFKKAYLSITHRKTCSCFVSCF